MSGGTRCPSCGGNYREQCADVASVLEFFACCVRCGVTFDSPFMYRRAAAAEADRIEEALNYLDGFFAEDGVVKTMLRQHIQQKRRCTEGLETAEQSVEKVRCNLCESLYKPGERHACARVAQKFGPAAARIVSDKKEAERTRVAAAKAEIAEEDRRAVEARLARHATPAYRAQVDEGSRRTKLPSEHADHLCGMLCDGQDGSNSYCARLRRKLFPRDEAERCPTCLGFDCNCHG